ncbi:MAG: DUF4837 family protein [Bacteroidota bacterium]
MNKLFTGFSIVAIIGLILAGGCKPDNGKKRQQQEGVMPSVTGKTGDLVVVMDTSKFNSAIGSSLKKSLGAVFKGLPQPEPKFDLINIPHEALDRGFKTHRNVLRVNVDGKYTEPRFAVRKNVFARPQTLVEAQAPNDSVLKRLFESQGDELAQKFIEGEWNRYIKLYKGMRKQGVINHLEEKFGISMVIPKGYSLDKDTTNFSWIAKEAPRYSQAFLVYKYPYSGEETFTPGYQVKMRNRFTRKFVPGPSPNSYMTVETSVTPHFKEKVINGHTVYELRGLWKVKNDFMGGPFVSYTLFDENTGNAVNIDGFVYAPRFDKRDYVREIEAILQTLELSE